MIMVNDPIVAEVRAIREKLAAQCKFDIVKICAEARRNQELSGAQIVSFEHARRDSSKTTAASNLGSTNEPSASGG
jgi:hypothetical protein